MSGSWVRSRSSSMFFEGGARASQLGATFSSTLKANTHVGDTADKGLFTSGSGADGLPPIGDELVASLGGLALERNFESSGDLDGRLADNVEGIDGLGLKSRSWQFVTRLSKRHRPGR